MSWSIRRVANGDYSSIAISSDTNLFVGANANTWNGYIRRVRFCPRFMGSGELIAVTT